MTSPMFSLRNFHTLRLLSCELRILLRSPDADSDTDEALSEGFLSQDSDEYLMSDPRDHLPYSIEELYLHGAFNQSERMHLSNIFESADAATPNLTLDKTRIRNVSASAGASLRIGGAKRLPRVFLHPLRKLLATGD
jgi:hypothetical protein